MAFSRWHCKCEQTLGAPLLSFLFRTTSFFGRSRGLRSTIKTCTTGRSRQRAIGSSCRGSRGTRSVRRTQRFCMQTADAQDRAGPSRPLGSRDHAERVHSHRLRLAENRSRASGGGPVQPGFGSQIFGGETQGGIWMEDFGGRKPLLDKNSKALPGHPALLATAKQHTQPAFANFKAKTLETGEIAGNCMIVHDS